MIFESFRVLDGAMVRPDLHRARFHAATGLGTLFDEALARVPRTGDWFPRISDEHGLELRPCPPVGVSVRLWSAPPFAWTDPTRKGPDVDRLLAVRRQAMAAGADEAVLAELEGSTSAIVWWVGDELRTTAAPVLASVTLAVIAEHVPVQRVDPVTADLAGREVWVLNALHGIRPVTAWLGGPPVGEPVRAPAWRARYETWRRPL